MQPPSRPKNLVQTSTTLKKTRQLRIGNEPLCLWVCPMFHGLTQVLGMRFTAGGRGAGFSRFPWLTGREGELHWHRPDPASFTLYTQP
jgi:hypothetical protein